MTIILLRLRNTKEVLPKSPVWNIMRGKFFGVFWIKCPFKACSHQKKCSKRIFGLLNISFTG